MSLTKEQLLIPRVMCIGGKEGEPNYPDSPYKTGQVLYIHTVNMNEGDIPKDAVCIFDIRQQDFPHLFRPMPWWEGRNTKDMPEYVNTNSVYGIRKVKEWAFIKGKELEHWRVEDTRGEIYGTLFFDLTPATEQEYEDYQKQKEAL